MFEVGEKVVCIDNMSRKLSPSYWAGKRLLGIEIGQIYIISGMFYTNGVLTFHIEGIKNNHVYSWIKGKILETDTDRGYRASRFRKLIKKKTDISVFQQIRINVEDNKHLYIEENENV